jgi:hypothetical protein
VPIIAAMKNPRERRADLSGTSEQLGQKVAVQFQASVETAGNVKVLLLKILDWCRNKSDSRNRKLLVELSGSCGDWFVDEVFCFLREDDCTIRLRPDRHGRRRYNNMPHFPVWHRER